MRPGSAAGFVAAGDQPVAQEALGEGVVVGDGQFGLEDGGQLGGVLGVHDDLHVVRGADVQAVGGQQSQGDVAQPLGDLASGSGRCAWIW
jgi:hypothetical protein